MKTDETRIRSAEETMKQGREEMGAGKREIEKARRLMQQSFRQTFPKLPLMETHYPKRRSASAGRRFSAAPAACELINAVPEEE